VVRSGRSLEWATYPALNRALLVGESRNSFHPKLALPDARNRDFYLLSRGLEKSHEVRKRSERSRIESMF